MQKLTLKRRVSGIHAVHAPDGEPLGVVNPADLDLTDDELSELMQKHAEKRAAQGAAAEFIKKIEENMAKAGTTYKEAAIQTARENPVLASEYRASVLGTDLLQRRALWLLH